MGVGLLTRGEITAFLNVDGDPIKGDILMMLEKDQRIK